MDGLIDGDYVVNVHDGVLFGCEEKQTHFCRRRDGPGGRCVERNKQDSKDKHHIFPCLRTLDSV